MKVNLYIQAECPSCHYVMMESKEGYIYCSQETCENYNVMYERPSVELKKVDKIRYYHVAGINHESNSSI